MTPSTGPADSLAGHPVGDRHARQRFIARSIWFTVPGTLLVLFAGTTLVPPPGGVDAAPERVLLALRWLPIALLPYAAVCLHIAAARFFEGSHDPLAGAESDRLKVHCRVMQNTLEQFVWFVVCLLALAALAPPRQMGIVPVACTFFVFARLVYWWGYLRHGTLGRAPGVQLTFTLNVALLVHVLALFARPWMA